jgi:electron transfer flavoprotein alpha subunit
MNSLIVATESRRIGGLVKTARLLEGKVSLAVVGPESLANELATVGADEVIHFHVSDDIPAEAAAAGVAAEVAKAMPDAVISNDAPAARMILGAIAARIDAAVLGQVVEMGVKDGAIYAGSEVVDGKIIEEVESSGPIACVYIGPDADTEEAPASPITTAEVECSNARIVEVVKADADAEGIEFARRIVGVGMGVCSRDCLAKMEEFAKTLGAQMACTLPVCDDVHWYPRDRVLGSSHYSSTPDLYFAVGASGSPNHTSGFRDAKVIVAINTDPEAAIFRVADYGIVGDLEKVLPAIETAIAQ